MATNPETGELFEQDAGSTTNVLSDIRGQGIPRFTGGISLSYSFGALTISSLASFGGGFQLFDRFASAQTATDGARDYSMSICQLDRWTPDNPNGSAPLRVNNSHLVHNHTRALVSGNYFKVRNIRVQYSMPERVVKALRFNDATVFVQTENPFIFSHIPGFNPELSISGYRLSDQFPTPVSFIAGLTFNF
jgi:hypothetical protein